MAVKLPIFTARHFGENMKRHFPKKFFTEIWLIIEDHEYIYITGMKKKRKFQCYRNIDSEQKKIFFIVVYNRS